MNPSIHRLIRPSAKPHKSQSNPTAPLLPHERDESSDDVEHLPDPQMIQAKADIDAGLVDTDMRSTPGVDASRRAALVPGKSGKTLTLKKD